MNSFPDIKVSLIIPVYNVEDYIERCLTSVVKQTLKDIEIIIVNDGSSDKSMEIVNRFDVKYANIYIVNKVNGGLSSARNSGLKVASGKYIAFIDSDDYIDETMLEQMYNSAEVNGFEIVACNLTKVDLSDKILEVQKNTVNYNHTYAKHDVIGEYLLNNIPSYAWNKLYLKKLFDEYKITYPEGRLYEDIGTTFELLFRAEKIGFIDKSLYFYVQRDGAITKVPSFKAGIDIILIIDGIKSILEANDMYNNYEEAFQNFALKYLFLANVLFYKRYVLTKDKEKLNRFKKLATTRMQYLKFKVILKSKYLKTTDKLKYILLKSSTIYLAVSIRESLLKLKNKPHMEGE